MLSKTWKSWKRKIKSLIIAYGGKYIIRCILKTSKVSVEGLDSFIATAEKDKCILVLWHNRLAITSEILVRYAPHFSYTALVSNSRDGDPLTLLAHSYSQGNTIRVPHNARHIALKKVSESLKHKSEIVVITPDGPRGPRYAVKPGIAWLAQETQATLIPFSWTADKYWELNTWDRFRFPKFFSRIKITFGPPFELASSQIEDRGLIQEEITQALNKLEPDHTPFYG